MGLMLGFCIALQGVRRGGKILASVWSKAENTEANLSKRQTESGAQMHSLQKEGNHCREGKAQCLSLRVRSKVPSPRLPVLNTPGSDHFNPGTLLDALFPG